MQIPPEDVEPGEEKLCGTMNLLIARQSGTEIYFYHTLSVNCMLSSSGSDPNKPCVFPFIYMDETYNSCTTIDSNREVFFLCDINSINQDYHSGLVFH